jgi:CheY-like chemotaxis protein
VEQRERQRIAGDLHDYLAQVLALGRMKLSQAKREELPPRSRGFIEESDDMLAQALTYTRSLVAELSPPILRESGLPQAIKWLAEQMRLRDMTVAVDCDMDLEWVNDDQSVLLFQSARELLINVSKHAGTPRASVSVWIKDKLLHLCVADDGAGFDSTETSANGKGTKFGLFSIRERMEDLGGRVSIESAPGQGTKITLIVPLERTPLKWDGVRPAGKSDFGRALVEQRTVDTVETKDALQDIISRNLRQTSVSRVLLVDDHALLRQGLRTVLEEHADIEVVGEATDGAHAVILAKSLKPDVVIMDVSMPRMDGIEATRQLNKELPGTIVIGLSVDSNKAVAELMREAGAVSFLTKDVASEKLHETIVHALRSTT